jgi:hypothetical protein
VDEVITDFIQKHQIDPIAFITFEQGKKLVSNERLKQRKETGLADDLKRLQIRDRLFLHYSCTYAENSLKSNVEQRSEYFVTFIHLSDNRIGLRSLETQLCSIVLDTPTFIYS